MKMKKKKKNESEEEEVEGHSYLLGDELSMADISVFSMVYWIEQTELGHKLVHEHQNIVDWLKLVDEKTKPVSS